MTLQPSKTILLVEDETIIALAEAKTIKQFGYEVIIAYSGEAAVEISAANRAIDLVLMDIDLGKGINGPEAAAQILKNRALPIVFLTSHAEREMVEKVRGITRYGYVMKNAGDYVLQSSIETAFELFAALHHAETTALAHRESEARYRLISENTADVIWTLSIKTGKFTYVSPSVQKLRGYTPEEVMNQTLAEALTPKSLAEATEALQQHAAAVSAGRADMTMSMNLVDQPCKDGSIVHTEVAATCTTDEHGNLNEIIGVTRNITDRRRVEEELQATLADLKKSQQMAQVGSWKLDLSTNIFTVSEEGLRTFGFPPGSRPAFQEVRECLLPADRERSSSVLKQSLQTGNPYSIEIQMQRKDTGEIRSIISNAEIVLRPDGKPIAVVGTNQDVTERKKTEEEIHRINTLLTSIIENNPNTIFLKDAKELRFVLFNRAAEALTGFSRDDLLGKNDYDFVPKEQADFFTEKDRAVLRGKDVVEIPEEPVQTRLQGERILHTKKVSLLDAHEEPEYLLGISEDITERKLAEKKILSLLQEKELLLKEVHHRIKNNMSTVISMLSLQSDSISDPSAAAALNDAGGRVRSMMMLYDKLYRSDEFGEMPVKEYLEPLIDEIIGNFPNKDIVTIEKNIEDFALDARIISPIGIIVNELLTNIMKYEFTGRISGVIAVSASMMERRVSIAVKDNGVGIPLSIDINASPGFGLQLVDMLAKQIQGTIRIERGNETKFVLEFDLP